MRETTRPAASIAAAYSYRSETGARPTRGPAVILWHVGGALALARWVFRDPNMDLRVLVLGALLPDIVDKPVRLISWGAFETNRLFAHTLLFSVVVLAVVMVATRRGTPARKRWMLLPIGLFLHLVLDIPHESETFWWPFLGWEFPPFEYHGIGDLGAYLGRSPWVVAQEVLGLVYLVFFWRKERLSDPARRRQLVATGKLD